MFWTFDGLSLTDRFMVIPFNGTLWLQKEIEAAIVPMGDEVNWRQGGDVTPEQAANAMAAAYQARYFMPDPTGQIVAYGLSPGALPPGVLYCDGGAYATTDYPVLFGAIGYTFGGAGSSFNVPDLRGRTVVGVGTGSGLSTRALADSFGEQSHTLTLAESPSHSHSNSPHGHSESGAAPNLTTIGPGAPEPTALPIPAVTGFTSIIIDPAGGDGAHNNMQPSFALTYAIITGQ